MTSSSDRSRRAAVPIFALLLVGAAPLPIEQLSPYAVFWTAPAILVAAMLIAWAAESAQYFVAQGFALAILAWLQTLPEFAVEAVLAWKQQTHLLVANLTGALRLLTGLGWPMIYFTAAMFHRARRKQPLRGIALEEAHCVEVVALLVCMAYFAVIWAKGTLGLIDAAVLIAIYVVYLLILRKMPPEEAESVEEMERIPRAIVTAKPNVRTAVIIGLFVAGGALIYFTAEPFLASLLAVSAVLGVPNFVFVQWVAPFVSEFPEKVSAFYWARTVERASMALMNMVSSNINQWTLLAAMLPIVFSISVGTPSTIVFDQQQELEILMTLGQSLVGAIFLINMRLDWWEAAALFGLWFIQFALSPVAPGPGFWGTLAGGIHWWVTIAYFVWAAAGIASIATGRRKALAFVYFRHVWQSHIRPLR